jgi:hypothetical protein
LLCRRQTARFGVALGGDDVDADHGIGTVKLFGRLETAAVDLQRRNELFGREMRGEGIGQAELGHEHRSKIARSEYPQRHFRSRGRHCLDTLVWTGRSQECLQLENVLREILGRFGRAAQGTQRELVGAGGAAQPEVDAAWKQPRQSPKLFGDDAAAFTLVGKRRRPPPQRSNAR